MTARSGLKGWLFGILSIYDPHDPDEIHAITIPIVSSCSNDNSAVNVSDGERDDRVAKGQTMTAQSTTAFDYAAEAELFPARNKRSKRQSIGYRRFERAADAIRFAIEELPPELLLGAWLEVDEQRYDGRGIRHLYESTDYPLPRRAAA